MNNYTGILIDWEIRHEQYSFFFFFKYGGYWTMTKNIKGICKIHTFLSNQIHLSYN